MANPASMALILAVSSEAFLHSIESSHVSCFSVGTPSVLILCSSCVSVILYLLLKRLSIASKRASSLSRWVRSSLAVLSSMVMVFICMCLF